LKTIPANLDIVTAGEKVSCIIIILWLYKEAEILQSGYPLWQAELQKKEKSSATLIVTPLGDAGSSALYPVYKEFSQSTSLPFSESEPGGTVLALAQKSVVVVKVVVKVVAAGDAVGRGVGSSPLAPPPQPCKEKAITPAKPTHNKLELTIVDRQIKRQKNSSAQKTEES